MSKYRHNLPQLAGETLITDGGIETTLVFHEGLSLPCFAAFDALKDSTGRRTLLRYFRPYLELVRQFGIGMILGTPTWRASPDWLERTGYPQHALAEINRHSVELMQQLRELFETPTTKLVVSGEIGPRGDGYVPTTSMTADEAAAYHRPQIDALAEAGVDMVTGLTLNYVEEGIGLARAATAASVPVVVSFTVETDGRLPSGMPLGTAIETVDRQTNSAPAYFMINCAHPTHFVEVLRSGGPWLSRIAGVRANASTMSHAELDNATQLDPGNPQQLAQSYVELQQLLNNLRVLGGCCGTDHRHLQEICRACVAN